jgi:CRISPR system Cascade subunit CasD
MDTTLLFRVEGPMQSWGTQSRFTHRDTGHEPSKSGIVGLLCAALGKPREEKSDDSFPTLRQLSALEMGVRVDREGRIERDYHTAQNILKAGAKRPEKPLPSDRKPTELSNRFYLADASFLVGLHGEASLLEYIAAQLQNPVWPLFLGRRAFSPAKPAVPPCFLNGEPWAALQEVELLTALKQAPWAKPPVPKRFIPIKLRFVLDDPSGPDVRQDIPISFELGFRRRYSARRTRTEFIHVTDLPNLIGRDESKEGS